MKAKSSKQPKGKNSSVQIKDLQPTKDSKGQAARREMAGRIVIYRPGIASL